MFINSLIENLGSGDLYLVVDANFPEPFLGSGSFNLGSSASIATTTGGLWVYTSQQSLNSILGTLNGSFFTAGPIFEDTSSEVWCTYYPSTPTAGAPFTIFYKECVQELATQAEIVTSQALVDLHPANEFPGWWKTFSIASEIGVPYKLPFYITQRVLGNIWLPKTYTAYLHDTLDVD